MEEEGIYYFFEHIRTQIPIRAAIQVAAGKHMLVLANDPAGHNPVPASPRPAAISPSAAGGWRSDQRLAHRAGVPSQRLGPHGLQF